MCAFVVLGLFFHTKAIDWLGERLRNDLFCVVWDVKPQLRQNDPSCLPPPVTDEDLCGCGTGFYRLSPNRQCQSTEGNSKHWPQPGKTIVSSSEWRDFTACQLSDTVEANVGI